MTSRIDAIESANASPSTPIGPTRTDISGTLMATAMMAQATGVRVSCMA